MTLLEKEVQEARALGLSYGQYRAKKLMEEGRSLVPAPRPDPPKRFQVKKYDDEAAFRLWQQGRTDREIAAVFGVSRTIIQRWRDALELPSTVSFPWINTQAWRLTRHGRDYIVLPPAMVYKLERAGSEVRALEIRVQPGIFGKKL